MRDAQAAFVLKRLTHAALGGMTGGCAGLIVIAALLHSEMAGFGALGGTVVGAIGGALARARAHEIAICGAVWGALLGPIVGFGLLAAAVLISGIGP